MRFWFKKKTKLKKDKDIDAVVEEFTEESPSKNEKQLRLLSRLHYLRKLNARFVKGTDVKSATKKEKSK